MSEEKVLSNIAAVALTAVTAIVELVMTYVLLILNALPALQRGYIMIFYIPIIAWTLLSILWCYGMYLIISKKRRRRMIRKLKEEW
jgi:hypothetical protein